MAKSVFLGGESGNSRKIKQIFIGESNGLCRKVKKGFIGDSSGKARLFYTSDTYKWNRYNIVTNYKWNQYTVETVSSGYVSYGGGGSRQIQWNGTVWFFDRVPTYNGRWDTTHGSGTWNGVDAGDWVSIGSISGSSGGTLYLASQKVERKWVNGEYISTLYYSQTANLITTDSNTRGSLIGGVTSTSSSAYPSNGISGSYWYVSNGSEQTKGTLSGTVESDNPTAYPDNGISGNYWYVKVQE